MLNIHSLDDPLIVPDYIPFKEVHEEFRVMPGWEEDPFVCHSLNDLDYIGFVATRKGGHGGFFEGTVPLSQTFADRAAFEFFHTIMMNRSH